MELVTPNLAMSQQNVNPQSYRYSAKFLEHFLKHNSFDAEELYAALSVNCVNGLIYLHWTGFYKKDYMEVSFNSRDEFIVNHVVQGNLRQNTAYNFIHIQNVVVLDMITEYIKYSLRPEKKEENNERDSI